MAPDSGIAASVWQGSHGAARHKLHKDTFERTQKNTLFRHSEITRALKSNCRKYKKQNQSRVFPLNIVATFVCVCVCVDWWPKITPKFVISTNVTQSHGRENGKSKKVGQIAFSLKERTTLFQHTPTRETRICRERKKHYFNKSSRRV